MKIRLLLIRTNYRQLCLINVILILNQNVHLVSNLKILGIHIDQKRNINLHIDKIYQSVFKQLNAFTRIKRHLDKMKEKCLLRFFYIQILNTVVLFGCFLLPIKTSISFVLNNNLNPMTLQRKFQKLWKINQTDIRYRFFYFEVYKTLNNLNQNFINIF